MSSEIVNELISRGPAVLYSLHLDPDGELTLAWVSESVCEMLGMEGSAALAPGWWKDRVHPDDRDAAIAARRGISQSSSVEIDYRLRRDDGEYVWIYDQMRRVTTSDDRHDVVGAWVDITSYKVSENEIRDLNAMYAQAQKMEAIGNLAGGVAHDFNNLLTTIISFTRFVIDDLTPSDPRREDLVEALRAADSAARLTSQLLSFSRTRAHEKVTLDANDAIRTAAKMLQRTIGESVELVVVPRDESMWVSVARGQLDQLLFNLCLNARDAMRGAGGGTVTVETDQLQSHPRLGDGPFAVVRIRDDGEGIPQEHLDRIFEPFFSTKGEKGTGLGLATCYAIAKQAGGIIEVSSTQGEGSTFGVLLPLVDAPTTEAPKQARTSSKPREGSVLVCEDSPPIMRAIRRGLQRMGFDVVGAFSAEEALALVDDMSTAPAFLISDVMLPGLSGLELVRRLRERFECLPVLLISGYMDEDQGPGLTQEEGVAFLSKPFSSPELIVAVEKLFPS